MDAKVSQWMAATARSHLLTVPEPAADSTSGHRVFVPPISGISNERRPVAVGEMQMLAELAELAELSIDNPDDDTGGHLAMERKQLVESLLHLKSVLTGIDRVRPLK